ncbi:Alpha/Beta hydrolase protein [Radiomyces spectabilis]|uniref:Alpha/Beta hydrolase protein n=1 Tax=Radiomyces spectabilis TaxID=64574 RepID=UPI002220BF11|nr:Alpha/Beta hydrolase protein [Radiomyces spectabilis]KAI8391457.1 Alpha/Beta hydrolase protein [Radiomyces spectabilis]
MGFPKYASILLLSFCISCLYLFHIAVTRKFATFYNDYSAAVRSINVSLSHSLRYHHPTLCDPFVKQMSGYADIGSGKHLFFWFFEARRKAATAPTILWLNGGPGCSSLTGLFMELGPCRVTGGGNDTVINPHSWNEYANIIFLDQPASVGYSFGTENVDNSVAVANDVFAFLQQFFGDFPEYARRDFHIAGESYAGRYIPVLAALIQQHNHQVSKPLAATTIPLASLMFGNALVDPLVQYRYYPQMACNNFYKPVLNQTECQLMHHRVHPCVDRIEQCYKEPTVASCYSATTECNLHIVRPLIDQARYNPYDVRAECKDHTSICYSTFHDVALYLNREEVKQALGVGHQRIFESCSTEVQINFQLSGDWMKPYVDHLAPLLENGIRILVYAGNADLMCPWMGNKAWTQSLRWSGQKAYNQAEDKLWSSSTTGREAGQVRSTQDNRLSFVQIHEAGHMAPYDQPEHLLEMMNQWIHNKTL